jgi:hypothetical protein
MYRGQLYDVIHLNKVLIQAPAILIYCDTIPSLTIYCDNWVKWHKTYYVRS